MSHLKDKHLGDKHLEDKHLGHHLVEGSDHLEEDSVQQEEPPLEEDSGLLEVASHKELHLVEDSDLLEVGILVDLEEGTLVVRVELLQLVILASLAVGSLEEHRLEVGIRLEVGSCSCYIFK